LKTNIVFESDNVKPIDAIAHKLKANNDETTKMSVKFELGYLQQITKHTNLKN